MNLRLRARLRLLSILQVNGLRSHFVARKKLLADEVVCKNCETHYQGNYCPVCGQSRKVRRLSFLNMVDDFISIFINLDNGFLRTSTELFWRPGHMIRDYIEGHRKVYMKPLAMLFCLGTIYYLTVWLFAKDVIPDLTMQNAEINLGDEYNKYGPLLQKVQEVIGEILKNPGLVIFCFILPMAPATSLCFHGTRYGKVLNLMEHLHVLMFIGCQLLIVVWCTTMFHGMLHEHLEFLDFDFLYCFGLLTWDYHQLFRIGWMRSFKLVALSSLLAGLIAFVLLITTIAVGFGLVTASSIVDIF